MNSLKDNEYSLPDVFYSEEEIIENYGEHYRFFINETLLLKDMETYKEYTEEDVIELSKAGKYIKLNKYFLKELISNNALYKYVLKHMDNPHGIALKLALFENGDIVRNVILTRAELSEMLNKLDFKSLNPTEQMRITLINNLSTCYALNQKYKSKVHKCNVDGEDLEVKTSVLISILLLSEDEFNQFVANTRKYYYKKEIMAYMLVDFIQRERILEKYAIPEWQYRRYKNLENFELIDFEYINKNQKVNDYDNEGKSLVDQTIINDELRDAIFSTVNPLYSPLEKAIYIYIKMCELLTYDQSFYAANQRGIDKEKHEDINRIKDINLENNALVCYEFTMIYAKFLKELGIDITIDSALVYGYGGGHARLTFRYHEYLICADSVKSIIENDMANVKINAPINGLVCMNTNSITKNKFDELLYKVFKEYINEKNNTKEFSDSLREYKEKYANYKLETKEKLELLLKEITRKDLKGMDTIAYQKKIFRNIIEGKGNISINFISSSINTYKNLPFTPLTIISILTVNGYNYLLIDPNSPDVVESISLEELTDMFEANYYAYINVRDPKIPGLELGSDKKYVR